MSFKDRFGRPLGTRRIAGNEVVVPEKLAIGTAVPAHGIELVLLTARRPVTQPSVLRQVVVPITPANDLLLAPCNLGQQARVALQRSGPPVVADRVLIEALLDGFEILPGARGAVGIQIAGLPRPQVLVAFDHLGQPSADIVARLATAQRLLVIGRGTDHPVHHERPNPQRLPRKGHLACIVELGPFKALSAHFQLCVIEKALQLPGVKQPLRLCTTQRPLDELLHDFAQRRRPFIADVPQPFAQCRLVRELLNSQDRLKRVIIIQSAGIGQRVTPAGEAEYKSGHIYARIKSLAAVRPGVQTPILFYPIPQTKLMRQPVHSKLASVGCRAV